MKALFKLFIGVVILVLLVPLLWFLVKELWFFAGNMFAGMSVSGCDVGWLALFVVSVLLLIFFIKIIID